MKKAATTSAGTPYFCKQMPRSLFIVLCLLLFSTGSLQLQARVDVRRYGISTPVDTVAINKAALRATDSIVQKIMPYKNVPVYYNLERVHPSQNRTVDFYLVLALCILLGLIRFADPHYFTILIRSFRNPSGSKHFKEQIQGAAIPNFLMNLFFAIITGAYIYYTGRVLALRLSDVFDGPLMLLWLIGGIGAIYLGKYFVIRFSGWAFRVETITEQYLFNVFLINKIIGICLLPFVVLIAFAGVEWINSLVVISLLIIGVLLFNRYARSWQVFGSFFQYSKFHFFTYLCASEILPMAILIKLLLRTMA